MKKEHLKNNEPLVRIIKKAELSTRQTLLLRLLALLIAIVCGGLFILAIGANPLGVYKTMLEGAFRSKLARVGTIKIMIPLLISSLGITLAFKMKFWNIGAEGQIIMGSVFATYFALYHNNWNHYVLLTVMLLAGAVGGGLMALLPAIFKSRFNTNETLFTLMLNYVALYLVVYLIDGPWRDPESAGFSKIATFTENARLGKVLGVQSGWIIALILLVAVFVYLKFTKQGYEIAVVGESEATARYAGMHVRRIILRTMFLSGAICGIGGMIQVSGTAGTLTTGVAGGVGFTAIIVAWLSQLNPLTIFVVSFLFSVMEKGSSLVETDFGLSSASSAVLQGIILFFVIGCEFFIRYQFAFRKRENKQEKEAA